MRGMTCTSPKQPAESGLRQLCVAACARKSRTLPAEPSANCSCQLPCRLSTGLSFVGSATRRDAVIPVACRGAAYFRDRRQPSSLQPSWPPPRRSCAGGDPGLGCRRMWKAGFRRLLDLRSLDIRGGPAVHVAAVLLPLRQCRLHQQRRMHAQRQVKAMGTAFLSYSRRHGDQRCPAPMANTAARATAALDIVGGLAIHDQANSRRLAGCASAAWCERGRSAAEHQNVCATT